MNLKTTFPYASKTFIELNANGKLSSGELEQNAPNPLGKTKKRTRAIRGRTRVCYRSFTCRPLDADNLAGGTKICTDTLTRCGLLPADDPFNLRIEWEQHKVPSYADEKLEIEITKL